LQACFAARLMTPNQTLRPSRATRSRKSSEYGERAVIGFLSLSSPELTPPTPYTTGAATFAIKANATAQWSIHNFLAIAVRDRRYSWDVLKVDNVPFNYWRLQIRLLPLIFNSQFAEKGIKAARAECFLFKRVVARQALTMTAARRERAVSLTVSGGRLAAKQLHLFAYMLDILFILFLQSRLFYLVHPFRPDGGAHVELAVAWHVEP
jgi:hypothetical protein